MADDGPTTAGEVWRKVRERNKTSSLLYERRKFINDMNTTVYKRQAILNDQTIDDSWLEATREHIQLIQASSYLERVDVLPEVARTIVTRFSICMVCLNAYPLFSLHVYSGWSALKNIALSIPTFIPHSAATHNKLRQDLSRNALVQRTHHRRRYHRFPWVCVRKKISLRHSYV